MMITSNSKYQQVNRITHQKYHSTCPKLLWEGVEKKGKKNCLGHKKKKKKKFYGWMDLPLGRLVRYFIYFF